MGLFFDILEEMRLLKEDASINDINDAIDNIKPAIIRYKNENGEYSAEGERKIFPIAYGISTAGNPVIRAFEKEGDTATNVPAWKLFLLSNIVSWETVSDETFKDEELNGINKTGKDKQIQTLYNVSPLSDTAKKWVQNEPIIKSTPVNKDDVNREFSSEDMVNYTINSSDDKKNVDFSNKNTTIVNNEPDNEILAKKETMPISKTEIDTDFNNANTENVTDDSETADNNDEERMFPDDNPIKKDEIEGDSENNENELSNAYSNLMDRWNGSEEEK